MNTTFIKKEKRKLRDNFDVRDTFSEPRVGKGLVQSCFFLFSRVVHNKRTKLSADYGGCPLNIKGCLKKNCILFHHQQLMINPFRFT